MSRSQSPNRFRDTTVIIIANPGKVDDHQIPPASLSRPSAIIDPQAGAPAVDEEQALEKTMTSTPNRPEPASADDETMRSTGMADQDT